MVFYGTSPVVKAVEGLTIRKSPFRLSPTRKANLRKRLRRVDDVIAAVAESGVETRSLSRAVALPKEHEMEARGQHIHLGMNISDDQTSTRRLVHTEEDSGRVFTKCQSGQRSDCFDVTSETGADLSVDITGESQGILGYHCTFTFSAQLYIAFIHIISIMYNITTFLEQPALNYSTIKKSSYYTAIYPDTQESETRIPMNHLIGQPKPPAYHLPPPALYP